MPDCNIDPRRCARRDGRLVVARAVYSPKYLTAVVWYNIDRKSNYFYFFTGYLVIWNRKYLFYTMNINRNCLRYKYDVYIINNKSMSLKGTGMRWLFFSFKFLLLNNILNIIFSHYANMLNIIFAHCFREWGLNAQYSHTVRRCTTA